MHISFCRDRGASSLVLHEQMRTLLYCSKHCTSRLKLRRNKRVVSRSNLRRLRPRVTVHSLYMIRQTCPSAPRTNVAIFCRQQKIQRSPCNDDTTNLPRARHVRTSRSFVENRKYKGRRATTYIFTGNALSGQTAGAKNAILARRINRSSKKKKEKGLGT